MVASYRTISMSFALVALLGLVGAGCGDGKVNTNVDDSRNADESDNGTPPAVGDQYFMVPAGETHLIGNVTESVELKVFLYDTSTGDPVADESIPFEILNPDAGHGATLSAFNSTTDDNGAASVDLRLGTSEGTAQVRVEHELSNGVDFTVDIRPLETGDLEVSLVNSGASVQPLSDIDVRLYRNGDYSCGEFRPLATREDTQLESTVVASPASTVDFPELGTRQQFMVTAVARGTSGQLAAGACLEDIQINADQTTEKELVLQLVPLNPVGRYDVTAHWDFSNALADSGSVGSTIVDVLDIFENPGRELYDRAIDLVRTFVGGIGSFAVDQFLSLTGLDDLIQDTINNAIENNDALRRVRDAGRDLRDVVTNLEVHSELTIGKMASNYEFRGTDNWLGLTLYWRWNCDENAPPDCGAIDITADENGDFAELGVLSSNWTGRVVAYNQLQIDRHPMSLRYGRLIIYVLNEVILPQITDGNAHSMSEAFTYWVCDGFGTAVTGSDGEICALGACVHDDDISGFCSSASNFVFGFADTLVNQLDYDLGMSIGGEGTLIETTSDGLVDQINDGIYEGTLQNSDLGQTQASDISATWAGERVE